MPSQFIKASSQPLEGQRTEYPDFLYYPGELEAYEEREEEDLRAIQRVRNRKSAVYGLFSVVIILTVIGVTYLIFAIGGIQDSIEDLSDTDPGDPDAIHVTIYNQAEPGYIYLIVDDTIVDGRYLEVGERWSLEIEVHDMESHALFAYHELIRASDGDWASAGQYVTLNVEPVD